RSIRNNECKVSYMMEALSVCHNVTPVVTDGKIFYQASSPDELAIIYYLEEIGIILRGRTMKDLSINYNFVDSTECEIKYGIIHVFPFNSDVKRMGIIVKRMGNVPSDLSPYVFFLKGADMVMKEIVEENDWVEEETDNMAREGLRTLIVAKRELSEDEFHRFNKEYLNAKMTIKNRAQNMLAVQESLETNLTLFGLTGVEDKLQDQIKETLESLRSANIKIWMLTGDKIETAISIAKSSRLMSKNDQYMVISNCTSK
ncbi:unnamed protein product, partial [marine sediment metagenome]